MEKKLLSEELKRMQELSGIQNEYYMIGSGGSWNTKSGILKKVEYRMNELSYIKNQIEIVKDKLTDEQLTILDSELGNHINDMYDILKNIEKP
jgi:hypothetical protein